MKPFAPLALVLFIALTGNTQGQLSLLSAGKPIASGLTSGVTNVLKTVGQSVPATTTTASPPIKATSPSTPKSERSFFVQLQFDAVQKILDYFLKGDLNALVNPESKLPPGTAAFLYHYYVHNLPKVEAELKKFQAGLDKLINRLLSSAASFDFDKSLADFLALFPRTNISSYTNKTVVEVTGRLANITDFLNGTLIERQFEERLQNRTQEFIETLLSVRKEGEVETRIALFRAAEKIKSFADRSPRFDLDPEALEELRDELRDIAKNIKYQFTGLSDNQFLALSEGVITLQNVSTALGNKLVELRDDYHEFLESDDFDQLDRSFRNLTEQIFPNFLHVLYRGFEQTGYFDDLYKSVKNFTLPTPTAPTPISEETEAFARKAVDNLAELSKKLLNRAAEAEFEGNKNATKIYNNLGRVVRIALNGINSSIGGSENGAKAAIQRATDYLASGQRLIFLEGKFLRLPFQSNGLGFVNGNIAEIRQGLEKGLKVLEKNPSDIAGALAALPKLQPKVPGVPRI